MIIPIRCITCGKVLADKWNHFKKIKQEETSETDTNGLYKTRHGKELDALGLKRMCCRRHMIAHVDLIDEL